MTDFHADSARDLEELRAKLRDEPAPLTAGAWS